MYVTVDWNNTSSEYQRWEDVCLTRDEAIAVVKKSVKRAMREN